MPPKHLFKANGKVLLSGEYLVLNGALALGLPLSKGQRMSIVEGSGSEIVWESYLPDGSVWFSAKFDLFGFDPFKTADKEIANRLKSIFEAAVRLNSDFLSKWKKYRVSTYLDFQPEWGLGSSSTLIHCIAEWADVDPFDLLENTFGGSGYDIACASAEGPILYQVDETSICADPADFIPSFSDQLYFVYLGEKRDTRQAVEGFNGKKVSSADVDEISGITRDMCKVNDLPAFDELIRNHEKIISGLLGVPRIQSKMFGDYWGQVKSLGAWGGDFILVTSDRSASETEAYFSDKGLDVFFKFQDFVLNGVTVDQKV